MASVSRKLKRLKVYFSIVWAFNLFVYGIFSYGVLTSLIFERLSETNDLFQRVVVFGLLLFPCVFNYLAVSLLRYYPDKEMERWKRRVYNIVGVLQIIVVLILGAIALIYLSDEVIGRQNQVSGGNGPGFISYLWTISLSVASGWSLSAVIVVWRTMRVIRRNHRAALLEAFQKE